MKLALIPNENLIRIADFERECKLVDEEYTPIIVSVTISDYRCETEKKGKPKRTKEKTVLQVHEGFFPISKNEVTKVSAKRRKRISSLKILQIRGTERHFAMTDKL